MRLPRGTRYRAITVFTGMALMAASAGPARSQPPSEPKSGQPQVGQVGKDVMWVPTSPALVEKMLDMAQVTSDDLVMDLGSGDGRTVIAAARRGARAVGVEFNPELVTLSRRLAEEAGVGTRATFVEGDMYAADISKATVLALFLQAENLDKLRQRFLSLAPGSRIVINTYAIPGWEPDAREDLDGCAVYCRSLLYIVPAHVQGRWKTRRGELVLKQAFQTVSGTLETGATATLVTGRLRGVELELTAGTETLRATVAGERLKGALSGVRVTTR